MFKRICMRHLMIVIGLFLIGWFILSRTDAYQSLVNFLTPPQLPQLQVKSKETGQWMDQHWLNQNWGNQANNPSLNTKKYHHSSQGTRTIPLPYDWFVALEQPSDTPWGVLFSEYGQFSDNDYLLRFGFIRSEKDPDNNPDGLPVGFARTYSQNLLGLQGQTESVGLTCAACHTSHFIAPKDGKDVEYIVEGGPAMIDLGLMENALTAAIGQTLVSSTLPLFNDRFDRFARKVLGESYAPLTKMKLALSFQKLDIKLLSVPQGNVRVIEGFTRVDALNRIGNGVFANDIDRPQNLSSIDAPVNYPHIWTAPWFDWVQYDGSVMSPLVRNFGEAMGLQAFVDVKSPLEDNRFSTSVPVNNLLWMEKLLAGANPSKTGQFTGLRQPQWHLGDIDQQLANQGKEIYKDRCQSCHLPPLDDPSLLTNYFGKIYWQDADKNKQQTKDKVMQLKIIPISQIGTDDGQASVMVNRTVDISGQDNGPFLDNIPGIGIDQDICIRDPNLAYSDNPPGPYKQGNYLDFTTSKISDGANIPFGYALAAIVEESIDAWIRLQGITDPKAIARIKGERPNCIQAGMGYKARPLDGIWATAPFLHNGSVATLKDLLCSSSEERPRFVRLGGLEFDPNNIGLHQPDNYQQTAQRAVDKGKIYDPQGFFILDTLVAGNRNTGHEFSSKYQSDKTYLEQEKGVIGPKFTTEQCEALLEYLKTQ